MREFGDRPKRNIFRRGYLLLAGLERQLSEAKCTARGEMADRVISSNTVLGANVPPLGRSRDEHDARRSAHPAHVLVDATNAVRAVGVLVAVRLVTIGLHDLHACHLRAQFVGDQDRQRAPDALAHLRAVAHDGDRAVRPNMDEHVGVEARGAGFRGLRTGDRLGPRRLARFIRRSLRVHRKVITKRDTTDGEAARTEERPSRDPQRARAHRPPPAAFLIASRIRAYVPHRHRLPAIDWSICSSVGRGCFSSSADAVISWPAWQKPH